MSMLSPIVTASCDIRTYPIVVPFSIALESLPEAAIVIVRCTDAAGRTGTGEAAPFPTLTYDTTESATELLRHNLNGFAGKNVADALASLYEQAPEWRKTSVTAFCGLETALLDLLARQKNIPVSRLHGKAGLRSIESDITLPIMPAANVKEFFATFAGYGFRTIKIKVSGHVSQDLDLIHEVRKYVSANTILTLDGNQGFDTDRAKKLVAELNRSGVHPEFFEQPLPEDDWKGVWDLAANLPVPVCLDEAVRSAGDARQVVNEAGSLKKNLMINLKIMKSGIRETAEIMDIATAHDLPLMIGGMLESEIAMSHSLHLACGKGGVSYFDLDTPFFFRSSPAVDSPWHRKSSILVCPEEAGIGIDLA